MFPEKRRITRIAKCVVYYEDGTKRIEKVPVTNDYIKTKEGISEYVETIHGEHTKIMGLYKITGDKLEHLQKSWKSGEVIEELRGQKEI